MSIVKVAADQREARGEPPIVIINQQQSPTSKTFSTKNIGSAAVGTTTGFLANELTQKLPGYSDKLMSHRYGRRMTTALAGLAGAAGTYSLLNKGSNKGSGIYMM